MYHFTKRFLDIIFSCAALLFFFPVFFLISIIIYLTDGPPVFFLQERMGKNFGVFRIYKFRTMINSPANIENIISSRDDRRITRTGRFLRKYKLDELPQLLNVIKGDMSIVGPRPEIPKYVGLFHNDYSEILKVKPGITDFASIHFRDEAALINTYNADGIYTAKILPEKIILYKKYINEMGLLTDLKIILKTIKSIFYD